MRNTFLAYALIVSAVFIIAFFTGYLASEILMN